jgi:hypothetical protein
MAAPFDLVFSALRTTGNWCPLALALRLSRNDTFRLTRSAVVFGTTACAAAFDAGLFSTEPCTDLRAPRCLTASALVQLLYTTLKTCASQQACEVAAAAAPPEQLLPLLHKAGGVLMDALEAGAHGVRLLATVQDGMHRLSAVLASRVLTPWVLTCRPSLQPPSDNRVLTQSFLPLRLPAGGEEDKGDVLLPWMAQHAELMHVITCDASFQRHAQALAAAPAVKVVLCGQHCHQF